MAKKCLKLRHYQKSRDIILQRSEEYYENNKDEREKYQRDRFHSMTSEKRDKLNEYRSIVNQVKKRKIRLEKMLEIDIME